MAVILLFIDGVGLGDEKEYNPWATLPTPYLNKLLGSPLVSRASEGKKSKGLALLSADTRLGVEGYPQSATGQATIFTGRNAPQAMGAHQSGLPFKRLREWIESENIYHQFIKRGMTATFANSYTPEFFSRSATKKGWISTSTAAAQSAGIRLRNLDDLVKGDAVYHDLTRHTLRRVIPEVELITPEDAASHLYGIAQGVDLVIHEFFLSDLAGHRQDHELMQKVIQDYDRFLGSLVGKLHEEDALVLVSDHGNSEDFRISTHTMNPVPLLIIGNEAASIQAEWNKESVDLTYVTPLLIQLAEKRWKKGGERNG
ncbi:alkaline phosphatase family protein [Marininema halotolerans]|uniref:Metalloenzyme superfamily protein n=1 Tax=Marininema halotolerans TaxID=1155944 RepID=A0A1I6NTG6_9BACL|nr:alkaline phosphatase family protein [Marininema halotolerans]SFS31180.1 Metalloenzyme superfamily protein [Marininema halotolerans]